MIQNINEQTLMADYRVVSIDWMYEYYQKFDESLFVKAKKLRDENDKLKLQNTSDDIDEKTLKINNNTITTNKNTIENFNILSKRIKGYYKARKEYIRVLSVSDFVESTFPLTEDEAVAYESVLKCIKATKVLLNFGWDSASLLNVKQTNGVNPNKVFRLVYDLFSNILNNVRFPKKSVVDVYFDLSALVYAKHIFTHNRIRFITNDVILFRILQKHEKNVKLSLWEIAENEW